VIVSARPSQFLFDWPPVSAGESHWRKFDTSRQGHDTAQSVSLDGLLQTHMIDKGNMDHPILRLTYGWVSRGSGFAVRRAEKMGAQLGDRAASPT
jgi:hypothetical protein